MRSRTVRDWISIPVDTAEYYFQIDDRGISLSKNKNLMHFWHFSEWHTRWQISEPIKKSSSNIDSLDKENDRTETFRHWWGLKTIRLNYMKNPQQENVLWWRSANWTIPHWMIVIPLYTLSAYLLLVKPRKSKLIAPIQPDPSIHA